MDLDLYFRVIWRFRVLIIVGFVVAILLAVLSTARIHFSHGRPSLTYRQAEIWQSNSTLLIGQPKLRWGPPVVPTPKTGNTTHFRSTTTSSTDPTATTPVYDVPLNFGALAAFYARLANSDGVRRILVRDTGDPGARITAVPVVNTSSSRGGTLPFVNIIGTATSGAAARRLAGAGADAFSTFVNARQAAAKLPLSQRVEMQVVNLAQPAILAQGRKKTLPIAAFLTVMIAFIGCAFILENMRPRIAPVQETTQEARARAQAD